MENRVLRYFLVAAKEENITHAAEILHLSQPALSKQLMQLEEELGVKLFTRGKRNITLTEEGRFLRQRAQEIIDLTEKTERDFRDCLGSLSGTVSIGMGESMASAFIADVINEFGKEYPNVRFSYFSNNADAIKEQMEKGLLDIGVLIEPTDLNKYEYIHLPVIDRWGVLMPAKCTLAQKDEISPEDLKDRKLFIPKRSQAAIIDWMGEYYDECNNYLTHNLIYNTAMLVDKGMGVAVTLDGAVSLYKNPNLIFRPLCPKMEVTTVMVWKKYQAASPSVLKFIDRVKNTI